MESSDGATHTLAPSVLTLGVQPVRWKFRLNFLLWETIGLIFARVLGPRVSLLSPLGGLASCKDRSWNFSLLSMPAFQKLPSATLWVSLAPSDSSLLTLNNCLKRRSLFHLGDRGSARGPLSSLVALLCIHGCTRGEAHVSNASRCFCHAACASIKVDM